ncbi:Hsp20/alpha crystallin family protein [Halogeometricum sp. S1BR25-6]|uniref:Hsp20/alpha crystallin family protein n=1 Tax=Halogeometricum salsisoli TaxID=2950536 RepID=A0ABU2GET6_9EURY|nr:Hsp20/alpha crystallin family protein [Halogeometricum sp. S1BR25-6]MDS0299279.1 Hsp20/alpha crystallin family protein [Halogeometricum sp. S1BR25-6]
MSTQQFAGGDERFLRRYEYENEWVVAVDTGAFGDDVSVDVVGTTAIVVAESGDTITETEFELPGEDVAVATNNGVLTITIQK